MIFRRLAQQLKEQNWTAIAIEFVLLVLGVFLGIQAANWNASLADQRLGRKYSSYLRADLERDLAGRGALANYYGAVLDSIERTDQLLADPQSDAKELMVNAYRASEINFWPPSRSTWDEIVSSGNTALPPRDAARYAGEYFSIDISAETWDTLAQSDYRHRVRTILPIQVQNALRAGCGDIPDPNTSGQALFRFTPDCKLDLSPPMIAATAQALRADPVVAAELRQQYSDVRTAHVNLQGDATLIKQTIAALRAPAEDSP